MCWCPAPKKALYREEMLDPTFSCPGRRNLPKQGGPAQSIPCLWALRWYCSMGESVRAEPHSRDGLAEGTKVVGAALLVSPLPHSAGALGRAGPWEWDMANTTLWVSLPCDSEAKIYSRQKDKRNTNYGTIVWMFFNIRQQRRHLQCLQGWPMSSVCFPILLSALITGFQSSGPLEHLSSCTVIPCSEWMVRSLVKLIYLCLEYASHPVSSPQTWTGLICEAADGHTIGL